MNNAEATRRCQTLEIFGVQPLLVCKMATLNFKKWYNDWGQIMGVLLFIFAPRRD